MTAPSIRPSDVVAIAATTVFVCPLAVLNAMRVPPRPLKESAAAVGGGNQSPRIAGVGRAQNAEAEIRIRGVVGFTGGGKNDALGGISVAGLDGDRADGKRGLIVGDRSPSTLLAALFAALVDFQTPLCAPPM